MNAWEGDKTEFTSPSVNRTINAWESNKEELPPPNLNASIDLPSTSSLPEVEKTPIETDDIVHKKPSLPRFILRIWQFFAAIGAFAFQVGASPVIFLIIKNNVTILNFSSILVSQYHSNI